MTNKKLTMNQIATKHKELSIEQLKAFIAKKPHSYRHYSQRLSLLLKAAKDNGFYIGKDSFLHNR